jgi:hypothetical protein
VSLDIEDASVVVAAERQNSYIDRRRPSAGGVTMTYEERVEQAIGANDVETLVRYIYGYPCRCNTIKGEPLCVCKMLAKAARTKIVPLPLFSGKIQRV